MPEEMLFHLQIKDNLAVITYIRPPINMLSFYALGQLEEILLDISRRKDISVVVLTGGLDGFFIAHADVADVMRIENGEPPVGDPEAWDRVNELLTDMPQLTVAAVNGQAWGGGCETALACNLIVLSNKGHMRLLEVSKGVIPGAGGTQRLPRRIGTPRALRAILFGEILRGEEALACGLADALLPAEDFMAHLLAWLAPVLAQPVHSVLGAKRAIIAGMRVPLKEALAMEKDIFSRLVCCAETKALGEKTVETL